MYVACSTRCFSSLPLAEALKAIREMRFAKADLAITADGPHLRPEDVVADPFTTAKRLKAGNVPFAAFQFAPADATRPEAKSQLRVVCRLARTLAVPVVTLAAAPAESELAPEVIRLGECVQVAEAEGVILCLETHKDTLTAKPETCAELCRRVPGLMLALDPSHYLAAPGGPAEWDALAPYVRHVRLRDSGRTPESFQVRVGQGEVEYGRIITQLDRHHYERCLSVDIRDVPGNAFPVAPEVRKLKYLLESMV